MKQMLPLCLLALLAGGCTTTRQVQQNPGTDKKSTFRKKREPRQVNIVIDAATAKPQTTYYALTEGDMVTVTVNHVNTLVSIPALKMESQALAFSLPPQFDSVLKAASGGPAKAFNPLADTTRKSAIVNNKAAFIAAQAKAEAAILKLNRLLQLEPYLKQALSAPIADKDATVASIGTYFKTLIDATAPAKPDGPYLVQQKDAALAEIKAQYEEIKNLYNQLNPETAAATTTTTLSGTIRAKNGKGKGEAYTVDIKKVTEAQQPKIMQETFTAIRNEMAGLFKDSTQKAINKSIANSGLLLDVLQRSTFAVAVGPYQVKDDYFVLSGDIKDTAGKKVFSLPEPIKIPVWGGRKTHVSAGLAFEFGELQKKTYRVLHTATANDTSVTIEQYSRREMLAPRIAAFTHFYTRYPWLIQPAFTIGLSPNFTDLPSSRGYIGVSAMLGEKDKWVISIGLAGGQTDKLKDEYSAGRYDSKANPTFFKELSNLPESNLYKKAFVVGGFFGITYNVSKTDK